MKRKGFTLIELLVVLGLIALIGTIMLYVLIKTLKTFSTQTGASKKTVETSINTDILVFDLKHIGYGISKDESSLVLSYCNGTLDSDNPACNLASDKGAVDNKLLLIKETSNILRSSVPTIGLVVMNGTELVYAYPSSAASGSYNCTWMDNQKNLLGEAACDSAPSTQIAMGYPLDPKAACQSDTDVQCCKKQKCIGISYFLTDKNVPQSCKYTFVLRRDTPGGSGSIYQVPVINCVADWDVWFGLGDTQVEKWVNEIPYNGSDWSITSNQDLATSLKIMKVYLLVQASTSADPNYDVCTKSGIKCDDPDCGTDKVLVDTLNGTKVCLKHPLNNLWRHYRWKVVEITISNFPNIPTQ